MEETTQDIRQAIREILPDVIADGVQYFQKAIQKKQIINTYKLFIV